MTTATKPESLFYSRHMWKSNLDRLRTLAALRSVREQRLVHMHEVHNEACAKGLEQIEREMRKR